LKHPVSSLVFQSERLLCRRWIPEDFESLLAVYSDVEAMRYVGDGTPITRSECEEWFKVTEANYVKHGYGMFTLLAHESGVVVGFAGLVHPGGQAEPEIKYALLRAHWGRGLASELVPQLLTYGARTHALPRVIATVAPGNVASQRVLAKAGMSLVNRRANDDGSTTLVYEWRAPSAASQETPSK
jgi:[ribosomal protein S5]-alanine N-acetyltransferase